MNGLCTLTTGSWGSRPTAICFTTRAVHGSTLIWCNEEGHFHDIAFDAAKLPDTSGRPPTPMLAWQWVQAPKAEFGLAGKCKRILGQIVGIERDSR
jgi:hypothetical protein